MFCDSLSAIGASLRAIIHLKIAEVTCNLPLHGSPPPSTLHPYISAHGVDKTI